MITGKIALLTQGAPNYPDEAYAMIPFEVGDDITVENFVSHIQSEMAEPFGFIRMVAPGVHVRGWVFCDRLGSRLLVEAILNDYGIAVQHDE